MSKKKAAPKGKPAEQVPPPKPTDYSRYEPEDWVQFLKKLLKLVASVLIAVVDGLIDPDKMLRQLKGLLRKEDPDLRAARVAGKVANPKEGRTRELCAIYLVTGKRQDLLSAISRVKYSEDWVWIAKALAQRKQWRRLRQVMTMLPEADRPWSEVSLITARVNDQSEAQTQVTNTDLMIMLQRSVHYCEVTGGDWPYEMLCGIVDGEDWSPAEKNAALLLQARAQIALKHYDQALSTLEQMVDRLEDRAEHVELAIRLASKSLDRKHLSYARGKITQFSPEFPSRDLSMQRALLIEIRILLKEMDIRSARALDSRISWKPAEFEARCIIACHTNSETDLFVAKECLDYLIAETDPRFREALDSVRLKFIQTSLQISGAIGVPRPLAPLREIAKLIERAEYASQAFLAIYVAKMKDQKKLAATPEVKS